MALRTISATGGNFGSVSTWVEGVVPTSSDYVLGDATSGNLTLNTNYTVQYVDFTNYAALFNMSTFALTLGLANATSSFGPSMSFTYSLGGFGAITSGDYGRFACGVAHNFTQSGTVVIPQLSLGSGTKTLATDLYCFRLRNTLNGTLTINGNNLFVNEAILSYAETDLSDFSGTTKLIAQGGGTPNNTTNLPQIVGRFNGTLEIRGQYYTFWNGPNMRHNSTLITTTASNLSELIVIASSVGDSTTTWNFNMAQPCAAMSIAPQITNAAVVLTVNCIGEGLKCDILNIVSPFFRGAARDYTLMPPLRFFGTSCQIQQLFSTPVIKYSNHSVGFPTAAERFRKLTPLLRFDNIGTYSITNMHLIGFTQAVSTYISSVTASLDAKLITGSNSIVYGGSITDIDASNGSTLYLYGSGTISSSTNVSYGPPTGGGTTSVSQYAFGSIN